MHIAKQTIIVGAASLIVGAAAILGIRYVNYKPDTVHYHANFAMYVNGKREQFKGMQYYEETAMKACTIEKVDDPAERAHMHDNVNNVVHVEDHLVTWGNFFQNLEFGIGDDYLKTADGIYAPSDQSKLTFILNGKKVESIAGVIINDQDKLLVSYGASDDAQKQYDGIQNDARKYDLEQDPAGCSGSHGVDASERLKHLF